MTTIEQQILKQIDKHFPVLVAFLCTLFGIVIRISLFDIVSGDYTLFLLPWYEEIAENGLSQQVGDYNFAYQFIIWLMVKINIRPLLGYKLVSCTFDWMVAIAAGMIAWNVLDSDKIWKATLTYCAVWLSPIVFLNSAAWAQCDAIYTAFVLLAVLMLERKRYITAMILLGIGFAFKLHTVFALPIFLFVYFVRRKFSVIYFAIIPAAMIAVSSPLFFWGRKITEIFTIYSSQTNTYQWMVAGYPSVWSLLCQEKSPDQYLLLKQMAIIFTVFAIALIMIWWIRKSFIPTGQNLYIMAFLLIYTCVMFLPSMHERYGYLYEILAIILAVLFPKTIPLCAGLVCISLNTYGQCLFGVSVNRMLLTVINLIIYGIYIAYLANKLQSGEKPKENCIEQFPGIDIS